MPVPSVNIFRGSALRWSGTVAETGSIDRASGDRYVKVARADRTATSLPPPGYRPLTTQNFGALSETDAYPKYVVVGSSGNANCEKFAEDFRQEVGTGAALFYVDVMQSDAGVLLRKKLAAKGLDVREKAGGGFAVPVPQIIIIGRKGNRAVGAYEYLQKLIRHGESQNTFRGAKVLTKPSHVRRHLLDSKKRVTVVVGMRDSPFTAEAIDESVGSGRKTVFFDIGSPEALLLVRKTLGDKLASINKVYYDEGGYLREKKGTPIPQRFEYIPPTKKGIGRFEPIKTAQETIVIDKRPTDPKPESPAGIPRRAGVIKLERTADLKRVFNSTLPVFVVLGAAGNARFEEVAHSFAYDRRCGRNYRVLVLDKNDVMTSDVLNGLGLSIKAWRYPHPVQAFRFDGGGSKGYVRWDVRTEAEKQKDEKNPAPYRPTQSTDL